MVCLGRVEVAQRFDQYGRALRLGTDAAETVKVEFNPAQVSLRTLTLLFLEVIDPFSVDQQGEDRGRQYRTGMFYTDETQRAGSRNRICLATRTAVRH